MVARLQARGAGDGEIDEYPEIPVTLCCRIGNAAIAWRQTALSPETAPS
jgi:hypothetical protein